MEDWKAGLAPELRDNPNIAKFGSIEELVKSHINVQSIVGAEKIIMPKDANDTAGWTQVWSKLGRPEVATGYQVPTIEGLPEGFTIEEARVKEFQEAAHKLGLSQAQAAGLYQYYIGTQVGRFKEVMGSQDAALSAAEKAMRAEWGTGYEAQVSLAKKTLAWAVGAEEAKALGEAYGNDPRFLRMLAKVGNAMSEDVLGPGMPKPGDLTPDAAQKEISAIMAALKGPYFDANHPEHQAMVARVTQLMELANPGEMVAA